MFGKKMRRVWVNGLEMYTYFVPKKKLSTQFKHAFLVGVIIGSIIGLIIIKIYG